jgi:hypothetical protein
MELGRGYKRARVPRRRGQAFIELADELYPTGGVVSQACPLSI